MRVFLPCVSSVCFFLRHSLSERRCVHHEERTIIVFLPRMMMDDDGAEATMKKDKRGETKGASSSKWGKSEFCETMRRGQN